MQSNKALFDDVFNSWARWVNQGGNAPTGQSILSKLIENKGIFFYSGGGSGPMLDCIEAEVELALSALHLDNPASVHLFRLDYAAIRQRGFDASKPQLEKALALGISVRTYKRRLSVARAFVINQLKNKRNRNG
jgi:hypothetical protein